MNNYSILNYKYGCTIAMQDNISDTEALQRAYFSGHENHRKKEKGSSAKNSPKVMHTKVYNTAHKHYTK